MTSNPTPEKMVDKSIWWTFSESFYKPFAMLLRLKVEKTDGHQSRLHKIDLLKWKLKANS